MMWVTPSAMYRHPTSKILIGGNDDCDWVDAFWKEVVEFASCTLMGGEVSPLRSGIENGSSPGRSIVITTSPRTSGKVIVNDDVDAGSFACATRSSMMGKRTGCPRAVASVLMRSIIAASGPEATVIGTGCP